ncbi:hypothetical protein KIPE111705_20580 [Kibdelosporangium persicum]|uniref:Deoxyribonuclease NucA/NucB domain-containing protein n=1 Tax=Kibdelosporangium persicum TaxID=2698649 RepID=A0ABX2FJD5_9PSEU|nr:hypothetical protein [Kibdelosporangium persicum]NRN70997.1 hypothetical protein [Kibdelosporangium persicum]
MTGYTGFISVVGDPAEPTIDAAGNVVVSSPPQRTGTAEEAVRVAARRNNVFDADPAQRDKLESWSRAIAAQTAAQPPQQLLDECLKQPGADSPGGHVLFRGFWCQKRTVHGGIIVNGKIEGEFWVDYRAAAIGNPFVRKTHVFFRGDDYRTEGTFSGWSTLGLKYECRVLTVGCTADKGFVTKDIGDWDDGDWVDWTMDSDERQSSQEPERVLRHILGLTGQAIDDFGRPTVTGSGDITGFRCDSANYFPSPLRCVFTDVIPRLNYNFGNGYDEVVHHIRKAQNQPAQTYPNYGTPKNIPGKWASDASQPPLTRVQYNGEDWKKNAAEKDRACDKQPPYTGPGQLPDFDKTTRQCDEYPFATTQQGAGKGDGNFSIQDVPKEQNGLAGNALQWYLEWDRILYKDLDNYWVKAG